MFEDKEETVKLGESDDESSEETAKTRIHTIPDVFYGGKDPNIYEEKEKAKQEVIEQIKLEQSSGDEESEKEVANGLSTRKKLLIGGGVFLFVLAASGVSVGFYFGTFPSLSSMFAVSGEKKEQNQRQQQKNQPQNQEQTQQNQNQQQEQNNEETNVQADSQPDEQATTTATTTESNNTTTTSTEPNKPTNTKLTAQPLEFPNILLSDSVDIDSDELTDKEETVFNTDSGRWDTDGDGYYDGQEIKNLYNPSAESPTELIKSDSVSNYQNPRWNYQIYYPNSWEQSAVTDDYKQVLFSSITGDYIELRVEEKGSDESFNDWFAQRVEGQDRSELQEFTNEFDITGYRRRDKLVAYFPVEQSIYILIYNPGTTDSIPFRHVMNMMTQSFRPPESSAQLDNQNVIPSAPTSTSSNNTTTTNTTSTSTNTTTNNTTTNTSTGATTPTVTSSQTTTANTTTQTTTSS